MFTYLDRREEIKSDFLKKPFSCTYNWVLDWINLEIAKLPAGAKVLEMGTFVGGSTVMMARTNPLVTIHTIDTNNFTADNHMLHAMREMRNLPLLVAGDLLEIQKMHLEDFENIVAHTGDSKSLDIYNFSVVFIDADHEEHIVYADLEYAWEHMVEGGFIYGDDANSKGVFNAFCKFAKEKDVEFTLYSKGMRIQKTQRISPNTRFYAPEGDPVFYDIPLL